MLVRFVALSLFLLVSGCDSLSEFNGSFRGSIVAGSFVRSCFSEKVVASLRFDPGQAVSPLEEVPQAERNRLTLTVSDDPEQVVFDAELEAIAPLANDTLADFDFPGPKRLRNFMLVARSSVGPLAGRDALVVVSLLASKRVEVRVMARADDAAPPCQAPPDADAGATASPRGDHEYYGFFRLK